MNRESRETTFDIAFGLLILLSLVFSIYAVRVNYLNSLKLEMNERDRARELRIDQRDYYIDKKDKDLQEVPEREGTGLLHRESSDLSAMLALFAL